MSQAAPTTPFFFDDMDSGDFKKYLEEAKNSICYPSSRVEPDRSASIVSEAVEIETSVGFANPRGDRTPFSPFISPELWAAVIASWAQLKDGVWCRRHETCRFKDDYYPDDFRVRSFDNGYVSPMTKKKAIKPYDLQCTQDIVLHSSDCGKLKRPCIRIRVNREFKMEPESVKGRGEPTKSVYKIRVSYMKRSQAREDLYWRYDATISSKDSALWDLDIEGGTLADVLEFSRKEGVRFGIEIEACGDGMYNTPFSHIVNVLVHKTRQICQRFSRFTGMQEEWQTEGGSEE